MANLIDPFVGARFIVPNATETNQNPGNQDTTNQDGGYQGLMNQTPTAVLGETDTSQQQLALDQNLKNQFIQIKGNLGTLGEIIQKDGQFYLVKNIIENGHIKRHTIKAINLDTGAVTSRIIANNSIASEDLKNNLTIQNLTIDGDFIVPNYIGQTSITTLGTIISGTWQGSLINSNYLGSNVMLEGENISLLTNNSGYITATSSDALTNKTWNGNTIGLAYGGTGTATGSITGTGALNFSAGGTNQNVTLTPSGSGYTILNGNVGIGTTNPGAFFSVGVSSQFQINSSGVITAATGITSSGAITFSGLIAGGIIKAGAGTGTLAIALAGTDYVAGGVGANNQVAYFSGLGTLTGSNGFWFNGTSVGIGTTAPNHMSKLDVSGTIFGNEIRFNSRKPRALVTFMIDDGNESDYTILKPAFDAKGVPAVSYVPTNSIGSSGTLSASQIQSLYADGWEIGSHTKTHSYLTQLTEAQVEDELSGSKQALEALGISVSSLSYPYSPEDRGERERRIARKYYRVGMGAGPGLNDYPINNYEIRTNPIDDPTQLAAYEALVDQAESEGKWVVFYYHSTDSSDATMVGQLVDYIKNKNISIVTPNQAIDLVGNVIDYGDDRGGGASFGDGGINTTKLSVGTWYPSARFTVTNPEYFNKVFYYNGSTYSDKTSASNISLGDRDTVVASTNDWFYVGKTDTFSKIYFDIATAGVGITLTAQYWNGSAWTTLVKTDGTINLTQDGTISFVTPTDWITTTVNAWPFYWVRIGTSTTPSTVPETYLAVPDDTDPLRVDSWHGDIGGNPSLFVSKNSLVGIGTGTPSATLDIRPSGQTGAPALNVYNSYYSTQLMQLSRSGTLMLGTTVEPTSTSLRIYRSSSSAIGISLTTSSSDPNSSNFRVTMAGDISAQGIDFMRGTTAKIQASGGKDIEIIPNSNKNVLFEMSGTGNVGIGTTSPNYILDVQHATSKINSKNGYLTNGADYAEYFYTDNTDLASGETVCVDIAKPNAVKRCERSGDNNVMGIVSTNPSIVGNNTEKRDNDPHYKIIGMLGQVPAKVSNENGQIQIGDSLTSANIPGYLRKANAGESTVGVAMQSANDNKTTIQVLISRRNQSLTVEKVEEAVTQNIANMNIQDQITKMIANAQDNIAKTQDFSSLQTQFSTLQDTQTQNFASLQILQKQMDDLQLQTKPIIDFYLALDLKNVLYKDTLGNFNLLDGKITAKDIEALNTIKAKDIEATDSLKGDNIELGKNSRGQAVIETGKKEITVNSTFVDKNSQIYLTPKNGFEKIYYSDEDIKSGESFTVKIDDAVDHDINFNWLIVK